VSRQLIGVDVGGTKISFAALIDGGIDEASIMPTTHSGGGALIDEIVQGVESARGPATAAVGVGVPSVVEFATGRVKSSVNIELADVPLRTVLQERLGLPVFVDNDANCAALAEAYDGERMVTRDIVMFTVGTGIGGGIVLNGRIYRGATGAAGEIGHTLIGLDLERGAPAGGPFPQRGSLESLASGRALDALGAEFAREQPQSALGREAEDHPVQGPDVVAKAKRGDEDACALIRILGERLGVGIANAINVFDPELVVIGGGVATAGELLLEPARQTAQRFVLPGVGERTSVRLARHGPRAGVLGAALLAGHELEASQPESEMNPPTIAP
jgi:glucokinase